MCSSDLARIGVGSWAARAVLGRLSAIAQSVLVTGGFGELDGAPTDVAARSLVVGPLDGPVVVLP